MTITRGGGVLIAVRNELSAVKLDLSSRGFDMLKTIDIVGAKCWVNHSCFFIFVIYVQPKTLVRDYALLFNLLTDLNELYDQHVLIIGNFNIPKYDGDLDNRAIGNNKLFELNTMVKFFNFVQFNKVANNNETFLGLVLSNQQSEDYLLSEDLHHPSLLIILTYQSSKTKVIAKSESSKSQ